MRFRVLGPLEVIEDRVPIALGGPKQQLVLAVLLAHAEGTVSTDRLIDEVWGEDPPATARRTLQGYVSKLGRILGDGRIAQRGSGYILVLDDAELDERVFTDLIQRSRATLRDDPRAASSALNQALALWRGSPFEGLADNSPSLRADVVRLEEMRLAAIEDRIEADLRVGSADGVVAELEGLTARHPLREALGFLLMVALYRSDRQSEALRVFQDSRTTLATELGLDPSPRLLELEARILEHDPVLATNAVFVAAAPPDRAEAARNPYKGLRAFTESDAGDFFGRHDLVRRIVERLAGRGPPGRLVVLAGPSGSGKSSVIRAGVVPQIRRGAVPDSGRWQIVEMYPGSDPFTQLGNTLADVAGGEQTDLVKRLRSGERIPDGAFIADTMLLIVDQCEELFTLTDDPVATERFLDLVASEATDDGSRVRAVLTIRADFLDDALRHPEFARLMSSALVLVTPLEDHEVRAAITEPAASVGVRVDAELAAEMTRDVSARPSALPLLQYSLTDLFDRRRSDTLTVADYRSGGGLLGALTRRATDVLDALNEAEREAARQLFLRLVTVTDETEHLRRRVTRTELADLPVDREALDAVLETFGDQRLLTFDRDLGTGDATVEVAHEALLRELPPLRRWLDHHREDLELRRKLAAAAREWREADKAESFLLTGARLARFEEWTETTDLLLTGHEQTYLDTSIENQRRRKAAELERGEQEKQLRRRSTTFRWVAASAVVVAVVLAGLTAFAIDQRRKSQNLAAEAVATETAQRLTSAADSVGATDPELASLLAVEAVTATDAPLPEAIAALRSAIRLNPQLFKVPGGDGTFSPDGRILATALGGGSVALWNAASGTQLRRVPGHPNLTSAIEFSTDGAVVATGGSDTLAKLWDVATGRLLQTFVGHQDLIGDVALSNDGRFLATASVDETARVWDIASGEQLLVLTKPFRLSARVARSFERGFPTSVAWTPDGSRVLTGDMGGDITAWDPLTGLETRSYNAHSERVWSILTTPDGHVVSAGWIDVVLSDPSTGRALRDYPNASDAVVDVALDASGQILVGAGNNRVTGWDVDTRDVLFTRVATLQDTDSASTQGDVAAGGTRVAVSTPGETFVLDTSTLGAAELHSITSPGGRIRGAAFSPDDRLVATAGNALSLWDAATPEVRTVPEPTGLTNEPIFSYDGRFVTSSGAGPSGVWDVQSGALLNQLPGSTVSAFNIVFTPDGTRIVRATAAGNIEVRDVGVPKVALDIESNQGVIRRVAVSPEGSVVATAGNDGTVRTFSLASGAPERVFEGHQGPVFAVAFSSNGSLIASAGNDGSARVWDSTTGDALRKLGGHIGAVSDVAFSPTDDVIATVGADGVVRLYATSGEELRSVSAHTGPRALRVAFSPDGNRIAGIGESSVTVWDVATGAELLNLTDHTAVPNSGAFSQVGDRLIAVGSDGVVRVFVLNIDDLIDVAQSRITRMLTPEECDRYSVACEHT